jgi:Domain of unknown function (DUF4262)
MTLSIEDANDLSALDAKVLREIHTDGWQITGVLDREPDIDTGFAYSIGFFHSMGHPEVILFGLPLDTCMRAVNVIGIDIQSGMRFEPGRVYDGILQRPHRVCFREIDRRYYRDYVGYALWFYEADPFPLYQCFWSDEFGRFPWEEGCSPYCKQAQPLLV